MYVQVCTFIQQSNNTRCEICNSFRVGGAPDVSPVGGISYIHMLSLTVLVSRLLAINILYVFLFLYLLLYRYLGDLSSILLERSSSLMFNSSSELRNSEPGESDLGGSLGLSPPTLLRQISNEVTKKLGLDRDFFCDICLENVPLNKKANLCCSHQFCLVCLPLMFCLVLSLSFIVSLLLGLCDSTVIALLVSVRVRVRASVSQTSDSIVNHELLFCFFCFNNSFFFINLLSTQ